MKLLTTIPAILSSLVLAAHFMHAGNVALTTFFAALPLTLLLFRRWTVLGVQLLLLCGAIVWLWTMVQLAQSYQEMGRPSHRMMILLTSVAAFTSMSAWLLGFSAPKSKPRPVQS